MGMFDFGGFDMLGGGSGGGGGMGGMFGGSGSGGGMGGMFGGSGGSGGGGMDMFGSMGGIGNLFAAYGIGGDASKIYGSKPITPTISDEQAKAVADANKIFPDAAALAGKVNTFTQDQKNKMMAMVAPNWMRNFGLEGDQIDKMMSGVLPDSDAAARQRSSIASALTGGFGNFGAGGAGSALVARDLGIAQQDVIDKGLQANERWIKTAESLTGPQFDFTKLFPSWQDEFSRDNQAALIAAAPDPVARGESDAYQALIAEILSVYSGGGAKYNAYQPNYGGGGYGGGSSGGYGGGGNGYWYSQPNTGQDINIYNAPASSGGWDAGQDMSAYV